MKFTIEEATQALKAAGVEAAEIVDKDSDYNVDTFLQTIDGKRSEILKPKWESEHGENMGKHAIEQLRGTLTSALVKATGIRRNELDKIEKLDERIAKAIEYKNSLHEGDAAQVEAKINELVSKHNEALSEITNKHSEEVNTWKTKYTQKEIGQYIHGKLKDAPILDSADRLIASNDFQNHLRSKFNLDYDESAAMLKLFSKDNPSMPALNSSGTAPVDLLSEAKEYFTPRGMWQTDMRHKNAVNELNNATASNGAHVANAGKATFADKFNASYQGEVPQPTQQL